MPTLESFEPFATAVTTRQEQVGRLVKVFWDANGGLP